MIFFILLFPRVAKLESNGELRVSVFFQFLRGNADRESEVKHFVYGVLLRYLRFLPRTHQGRVCMRIEVFGVEKKPSKCETGMCLCHHHGVGSISTISELQCSHKYFLKISKQGFSNLLCYFVDVCLLFRQVSRIFEIKDAKPLLITS